MDDLVRTHVRAHRCTVQFLDIKIITHNKVNSKYYDTVSRTKLIFLFSCLSTGANTKKRSISFILLS